MTKPDDQSEVKDHPRPSRLEEARRVIEEYAADLREIIKRLRRRLN
ncbi:hypothetical protein [Bradyrhizobium sp. CCBAU 11386]|nr:hypothetical protein [Bradyrhizobium sp. CCBAU 11386]